MSASVVRPLDCDLDLAAPPEIQDDPSICACAHPGRAPDLKSVIGIETPEIMSELSELSDHRHDLGLVVSGTSQPASKVLRQFGHEPGPFLTGGVVEQLARVTHASDFSRTPVPHGSTLNGEDCRSLVDAR